MINIWFYLLGSLVVLIGILLIRYLDSKHIYVKDIFVAIGLSIFSWITIVGIFWLMMINGLIALYEKYSNKKII